MTLPARAVNPFATQDLAAGYALARPAVHPLVIDRVARRLRLDPAAASVLDVGCGAGLSTAPLCGLARRVVGLEPAGLMLAHAAAIAPGARFVVGTAEAMPFRPESFTLLTAAGSLNYAPLERVFPEAARVLTPDGTLVVYDFTPGRSFQDDRALDAWADLFETRYPPPSGEAVYLDPDELRTRGSGFRVEAEERFEIPLTMTADAYLAYALTETSVAAAVRRGERLDDIRTWCAAGISLAFDGRPRDVLFRGYIACMRLAGAQPVPSSQVAIEK
jgi:SAM-dependent methyltransferase